MPKITELTNYTTPNASTDVLPIVDVSNDTTKKITAQNLLSPVYEGATTEILVGGGSGNKAVWTTATGTGSPVRTTSPTLVTPTLVTPTLGVATATSINKVTITQPATSATLTIANGKTLTVSQTVTLESGTDLYPIHEVTELCGVD